jgi:Dullard-like phosphatase family protein
MKNGFKSFRTIEMSVNKSGLITSKNANFLSPKLKKNPAGITFSARFSRMGSSEAFGLFSLERKSTASLAAKSSKTKAGPFGIKPKKGKSLDPKSLADTSILSLEGKDTDFSEEKKHNRLTSFSELNMPDSSTPQPSKERGTDTETTVDRYKYKAIESFKGLPMLNKTPTSQKLANNKYLYAESTSLSKVNLVFKYNLLGDDTKKDREVADENKTQIVSSRSLLLKLKHAATVDFTSLVNVHRSIGPSSEAKPALGSSTKSKEPLEKLTDKSGYYLLTEGKILQHWRDGLEDLRKAQNLFTLVGRSARPGMRIKLGPQRKKNSLTIFFDLDETLAHCSQTCDEQRLTIGSLDTQGEDSFVTVHTRPHVTDILLKLREHFELVLFTSASQKYAEALVGQFDPEGRIFDSRMYREHCLDVGGGIFVKDLSAVLDRQLSRVLLVDNCLYSGMNQLANLIPILPFTGDPQDDQLLELHSFLTQAVGLRGDVRRWLAQIAKFKVT